MEASKSVGSQRSPGSDKKARESGKNSSKYYNNWRKWPLSGSVHGNDRAQPDARCIHSADRGGGFSDARDSTRKYLA